MASRFARLMLGCVGVALTGTVMVADGGSASARDNIADFFASQFGLGGSEQGYAQPGWADQDSYERPLVVRPKRHPSAPRVAAVVVGPTKPVSIYEDTTLRRGDAVMTARGIRIFKGSASLPYRDEDFVAVSSASGLSKDVTRALVAINQMPRS